MSTSRTIDGDILGNAVASDRFDDRRLYAGVRTRRIFAFLIDYLIVVLLLIPAGVIVLLLGLLTFGLGWTLFAILFPIVAILYVWTTLGGRRRWACAPCRSGWNGSTAGRSTACWPWSTPYFSGPPTPFSRR